MLDKLSRALEPRLVTGGEFMRRKFLAGALPVVLLLQACSSRPREFTASLAAPPADQGQFDAAYAQCHELLVAGKLDASGRLASAGAGAAGAATVATVGGVAASTAGFYTGAAVAGATIIALPFVAVAGAVGMAKIKRGKKEKAIKAAMGGCLAERGYQVTGWTRAKKATRAPATPPPVN